MSKLMRGLALSGVALLMVVLNDARAQRGFELISPAEAQSEARAQADAPEQIAPRAAASPRGDATAIRVVSPTTVAGGGGVAAPVRIEVAFKPAPGARIVPSSFRVLYGLLKIDLTDRLRKHATVSESGVVVEQAQVPDGQHRLILQVADDQGNTAEQELRLRVGAAS
ncbi:conserved hypothetical protein [Rubrivivax sp. A210]|uniref:hypothetical protein n=1 Tax=Rubrivivax sp. A210 TaxID=2772301 RepID=UPI00191AF980|nr:hypothetical protein [Rubrivivax sp. A210]CAD5373265.1 conserved hypothetical protein [Rubrivivax sp. A210]